MTIDHHPAGRNHHDIAALVIELAAMSLYDVHPDQVDHGADSVAGRIRAIDVDDLEIALAYGVGLFVATIRALATERRCDPGDVLQTVAITVHTTRHGA